LRDRHRIGVGIDREGREVLINFRQAGRGASLAVSSSAASAIAATLGAASSSDDDTDLDFEVRGRLEVKEPTT